ncbi:MAG TPA: anthranilate synthase component I [Candidatus Goldiibacteriota bacterium]|nr:anthranilate synthase component I [Candidatus Goldiibacteriota bacterium]HRQ43788.1 anthranilate synthase component I [Candidatus Goldiibacteriota bacterium]
MEFTNIKEVLKLSKKFNVIPVYKEMLADLETPLSVYLRIDNPENSFLLESIEGGEKTARYSFIGRQPYCTFTYENGAAVIETKGNKKEIKTKDPLAVLKGVFKDFKAAEISGLPPFYGGAVGYVGYDVIKQYEKVPDKPKTDNLKWPDIFLMFADIVIVFDNVYHKIKVIHNIFVEGGDTESDIRKKHAAAVKKIDIIISDLKKPLKKLAFKKHKGRITLKNHTKKEVFKKSVSDAVSMLNNGEAIQVVLSQRFSAPFNGDPILLYRALRTINPSPYMFFIRFKNRYIIGASPEMMVNVSGRTAEVKPIAGTRKRGATAAEDKTLEAELLKDTKERAEHVMLVDLGRNDLGRVCETGTVKVNDFMFIEKYSHVMHIVSDVTGTVKKGLDAFDVFVSTFPAGTVSGAPKVRAMQMIDQFENIKRGPYSGSVGMIGFNGNMETCIAIRTLFYDKKRAYFQAGAGIVVDSDPEFEYKESLTKAAAMLKALEMAAKAEEM